MNRRTGWIIVLTGVALAAAFLMPAVRQPLEYHDFADHRHVFGVDNFLDVISNIGFLFAGLWGFFIVFGQRTSFEFPGERWPFAVFFFGVTLTALGSGYYHLAPDNETLFWDRLPMTIAFMGLVASQIVDRINVRAGLVLLLPMLLLGVASVVYWRATERMGAGNVLPYGILQGYSVVVLLLLAMLNPSRYTRGNDIYWVFGWYVFSKVLETFDAEVLEMNHLVSGHTLKHLAAAAGAFAVCHMLLRRTLKVPPIGAGRGA